MGRAGEVKVGPAGEVKVKAEAGEEEVTGEVEDSISTSMETEVSVLTLKAPITTAAGDKFCSIFPNF